MIRSVLFYIILLGNLNKTSAASLNARDSTPSSVVKNLVIIKILQNTDINEMAVVTPANDIYLMPNKGSTTTLSLSYKWVTISYHYAPKFLTTNRDEIEKGVSKMSGIGFNFNYKNLLQNLSFEKIRGYYLKNTADYYSDWEPGEPYIQFPDLYYKSYQGSTGYKFNPDFSMNALTTQTEKQLRNAGSFIPYLFYRYYKVDDRSVVSQPNQFTQRSKNFEIIAAAGYLYTFVLPKHFYLTLGGIPGAGYIFSKIETRSLSANQTDRQSNPVVRIQGKAGFGYNGPRLFAGIVADRNFTWFTQQHTAAQTRSSAMTFQIFLGYTIKAPQSLIHAENFLQQLFYRKNDRID